MASSGVKQLRSSESQVSTMTVAGAVFGVTAYALMNAMRRKPLMFGECAPSCNARCTRQTLDQQPIHSVKGRR